MNNRNFQKKFLRKVDRFIFSIYNEIKNLFRGGIMLYPKKNEKKIDMMLFQNPTREYRGAPFWSWNNKLSRPILEKEIEAMKKMGFGGYYMHPRVGLATPYLSEEFMEMVRACLEKGKQCDMNTYLYDEDKWPSGPAGGLVTDLSAEHLEKYLVMTPTIEEETEKRILLAVFDVALNEKGYLRSYTRIEKGDAVPDDHTKWFAYMEYGEYCDTMRKETIETFIAITHEKYKQYFGKEFGGYIPTIFSDEPQMRRKTPLAKASEKGKAVFPFTNDFDETYLAKYGESILDHLPTLLWETADGTPAPQRYRYHVHATERFAEAFTDTVGAWCEENGLLYTGHMMNETSLRSQTVHIGEAMRNLRGFGLPGFDILVDLREANTAKQAQSVAHQYGREGVTSELYGATNWDFDFRGHKLQGDWQAALGVTHRVPHLYFMSMEGEGKRDYPASIGHQSPWYTEYSRIEDHFARVNTIMTRGTPDVQIAVIHPIESYWFHYGADDVTGGVRSTLNERYMTLTNVLIRNLLDFDFISEALLPELYDENGEDLTIGKMRYRTVVVPPLSTMRSTTLNALKKFRKKGGEVIFLEHAPKYVDAQRSDEAVIFASQCRTIPFSENDITEALSHRKMIFITSKNGAPSRNLIYGMRTDGEKKHLFLSHFDKVDYNTAQTEEYRIALKGTWTICEYDTEKGEKRRLSVTYENGTTSFPWITAACGSLLLELTAKKDEEKDGFRYHLPTHNASFYPVHSAKYSLEEPNVLLLDTAEYSLNGDAFHPAEYYIHIQEELRRTLKIETHGQPWRYPRNEVPKDVVTLRFHICSEIEYEGAHLAMEYPKYTSLVWNGENVSVCPDGIYVDDAIVTVPIPKIKKGENELLVHLRYGDVNSIEAYYLLGNFGVTVHGTEAVITPLPEKLYFESLTHQALAFYSANVHYHIPFSGGGKSALSIAKYRGATIKVLVDGEEKGYIDVPPYRLSLGELTDGEHTLELILYGNRANTFSPLHSASEKLEWFFTGSRAWNPPECFRIPEYQLSRFGILSAPRILKED